MPTPETTQIARDVRRRLAGEALTQRQAKLYSQRLRREMGQEGLRTFSSNDVLLNLNDAMWLLECALIEREDDPDGSWRGGIKRAADILEWLSQSDLKPPGAPLHLLAAAAYQVAGYPAMALGHLQRVPDEPFSNLLREFLSGNFPGATDAVYEFWREQGGSQNADLRNELDVSVLAVRHVIMSIGNLCAYFRSGIDLMVERTLLKLDNLADGFLHSRDPYSHILARLVSITGKQYAQSSLWPQIHSLQNVSSARAAAAFVQFGRAAFMNRRALVWPAQAVGINRLLQNDSFVLCTPTGSGKTTIATLAIVQGLFAGDAIEQEILAAVGLGNLVLYLVPSRAIAAEVENRLAQDLQGIAAEQVIVTGLYGGVDWGPTDAWIQTGQPTIVICTFEKADALLRYLGVLFLTRVRLIVIDEAHMVEQNVARLDDLESGSSRTFRLEQLGTRLRYAQDTYAFRLIALSAVAAQAGPALARWLSGESTASPVTSAYRSTRQMLGRLEVNTSGQFTITYDLMDGRSLIFEDEQRNSSPYVPSPFPPLPGGMVDMNRPEASMNVPTLWAALQLASERPDGSRPSVLISLTQHIDSFARTCADQLDAWSAETLPNYMMADVTDERWIRCLACVADYFTTQSVEYRLLRRGIAVHHGKMPSLLSRRLKAVIDAGYVRVIIATSTLSEGVNIAVNYLLIPNIHRRQTALSVQEFSNLIGRVGRPSVATEGHAFVVLPERRRTGDGNLAPTNSRQWLGYGRLINSIQQSSSQQDTPQDAASSALSELLSAIERAWSELTGSSSEQEFADWLERTAVTDQGNANPARAVLLLDSLDSFLLTAIQEVEELRGGDLPANALEDELIRIWQRTYAFASARNEERLRRIWLSRGRVIKEQYPNPLSRRRIYKTSLSPRSALVLLDQAETMRVKLLEGASYGHMTVEGRFAFLRDVLDLLSSVPSFHLDQEIGSGANRQDWTTLLRWWVAKDTLRRQPPPAQITKWYHFVSTNFIYKGTWAIGSILGVLLELGEGDEPVRALQIDDWPRSGLPWVAFWLKELLTWGTLDPVAAFLLARGNRVDRPQAQSEAADYYAGHAELDANDLLDPRRIRDWMELRTSQEARVSAPRRFTIDARLDRDATSYIMEHLVVSPIEEGDDLRWIEPAGYTVARSQRPQEWPTVLSNYDFDLDVRESRISATPYLMYR